MSAAAHPSRARHTRTRLAASAPGSAAGRRSRARRTRARLAASTPGSATARRPRVPCALAWLVASEPESATARCPRARCVRARLAASVPWSAAARRSRAQFCRCRIRAQSCGSVSDFDALTTRTTSVRHRRACYPELEHLLTCIFSRARGSPFRFGKGEGSESARTRRRQGCSARWEQT